MQRLIAKLHESIPQPLQSIITEDRMQRGVEWGYGEFKDWALSTPESWDDDLVRRIGERLGLETVSDAPSERLVDELRRRGSPVPAPDIMATDEQVFGPRSHETVG